MEHNKKQTILFLGAMVISSLLLLLSPCAESRRSLEDIPKQDKELLSQAFIDQVKSTKETTCPQTKQICSKTVNPLICQQTVAVSNNKSEPITPKNVVLFQITAAMGETILAFNDCKDVAPGVVDKAGFTYCKGSYKKAGDELGNAINACKGDDMQATIGLVEGAMKHFENCQQDLDKNDKADSPLKEINQYMKQLGENSISIANAIADGSINNVRR